MPRYKPHEYLGGAIVRRKFNMDGGTLFAGDELSGAKIASMPSKHVLIARGFLEIFPT